jgi:DNA-binding beta-propeller fold protein YncE
MFESNSKSMQNVSPTKTPETNLRNRLSDSSRPLTTFGLLSCALLFALPALGQQHASTSGPTFKVLKTIPIGGEGEWGYASLGPDRRHLYVTRAKEVQVVNVDTGAVERVISNVTGQVTHSVVFVPGKNLGFVTAGKDENVAAFDPSTLKITARIASHVNPNFIFYDTFSKHVVVNNHEDVTIIDPDNLDKPVAVINLGSGGGLESGVSDGKGNVWVSNENRNEVDQIDTRTNSLVRRLSVAPGRIPAGIALDLKTNRLFVSCRTNASNDSKEEKTPGVLVVLDAATGKVLTSSAIGIYGSSTAIWDSTLGIVLTPSGTGAALTISKETSPGVFSAIQTLPTTAAARGIAYDEEKHRGYLPGHLPDGKFGIVVVGLK